MDFKLGMMIAYSQSDSRIVAINKAPDLMRKDRKFIRLFPLSAILTDLLKKDKEELLK